MAAKALPATENVAGQLVIRTYSGNQAQATARFKVDAAAMSAEGYFPTQQVWSPGQWSAGQFVVAVILCFFLIGFIALIYMLIVKPDGMLTVTYEQRTDLADEKTCPVCAERIKAAATVCRFCGYKFTPEEMETQRTEGMTAQRVADAKQAQLREEFPNELNGFLYRVEKDGRVHAADCLGNRLEFPNWRQFWGTAGR